MNQNNDSPDGQTDPLIEQLRQDALADRPAFSPELHQRILRHVRAAQPRTQTAVRYWSRIAAVAASLLICLWVAHRPHRTIPAGKPEVAQRVSIPTSMPQPMVSAGPFIPSELHIKGLVSATLWPPEIQVELPINLAVAQVPEPQPVAESAGLPQVLLNALQQQTNDANAALSGVVPANLRDLLVEVRSAKFDEEFR